MLIECPNGCKPSGFLAHPIGFKLPYWIEKDGTVTSIRWDGVVGITEKQRELLENTDNVFCPECMAGVNFNHNK